MIRWIPLLIVTLLVASLSIILLTQPQTNIHTDASPMLGKQIELPKLPSLRGDIPIYIASTSEQPVVLNLFASWCVPCLAEHPLLKSLQTAGHTVFGIGWSDSEANINAWLDEHGDPFNAIWIDEAGDSAVPLGLRGVPETYVLYKGKILFHHAGVLSEQIVQEQMLPLLEGTK